LHKKIKFEIEEIEKELKKYSELLIKIKKEKPVEENYESFKKNH